MPGTLLIPIENGRRVKTYGVNCYKLCIMKSTSLFLIIVISSFTFSYVHAEVEFYPGFRRPDPILKWDKEQFPEEFTLEQITNYLQEQEQQRRLALQLEIEPEFTFRLPARSINPDDAEFAIAPPDPRYYQSAPEDEDFLENYNQDEDEKRDMDENLIDEPVLKIRNEETKPETTVRYLREQEMSRMPVGLHHHQDQMVEMVPIKPAIQDETAEVYIIAVVAGISAAATVGLIAFAIGWYNLQKNVKNASDVEYPAYGVTGPNKDVSPTGDRRLAQSAQMYHYQHQKQQIIAMENRAGATVRHGSMSEAESDEENEEGDYTVYECPGLAPTGEMEVKNPLFQDDPTPAAASTTTTEDTLPDQK